MFGIRLDHTNARLENTLVHNKRINWDADGASVSRVAYVEI